MLHGDTLCFAFLIVNFSFRYLIFWRCNLQFLSFFSQLLGGQVPLNLPISQPKMEATSGNNASSNHSSDDVATMQKKEDCSEKGSDVQVWIVKFLIFCNHLVKGILSLRELLIWF